MPVDVPDPTTLAATTTTAAIPIAQPLAGVTSSLDPAQKKMAEFGLKSKKPTEDDPTDDDVNYLFELTKIAITNGAEVEKIDLKALIPYFEEDKKQNTKKYTNAKIVSFFTGGTFTFLMYLLIEYFKTIT
jgi:hypothetical protein